jgi:subtilisin family serine protease
MMRVLRFSFLAVFAAVWILWPAHVRTQNDASVSLPEHVMGRPVVAGEVLVRFRADASSRMTQIERSLDADGNRPLGAGAWRRLHSMSRTVQTLLSVLSSRSDVVEVEPNYILHTTAVPNDPFFSSLWGLSNSGRPNADIHAVAAWDVSTGSTANVVGLVDTGVDYNHPDLAANMWSAPRSSP